MTSGNSQPSTVTLAPAGIESTTGAALYRSRSGTIQHVTVVPTASGDMVVGAWKF